MNHMSHEEYVALQRRRVGTFARDILEGRLDILAGALEIMRQRSEIEIKENDPNSRDMRAPLGTMAIFCVMTAGFVLERTTGAVANDARLLELGALPDSGQLNHEYWRLITFGFLHYDVTHILLNTLLLFLVGPVVERRAGTAWLLVVFLSSSMASGIGILFKHQLWPSQGCSVGASGGLFGLLGAALVVVYRFPSQSRFVRVGLFFVLVAGLTYSVVPGVSLAGHIVGLIAGTAIALFAKAGA